MKEITCEKISETVAELCVSANIDLPPEICALIDKACETEVSDAGREALLALRENYKIAGAKKLPICQDTGMAVVFADVGQDVRITGGGFEDAVNDGVRRGYKKGLLRMSVVGDPLRRENTGDNTPAVIHSRLVPGEQLHLRVLPKGFGSENTGAMKMFLPSAATEDIIDFVVQTVERAGANPCPPVIVGVGLGGTSEMAALLAKRALLRAGSAGNADPFYAELEKNALKKINALGIGPQGFGGRVTALGVFVETFPTHIAGLPCVVNMSCHATRHAGAVL